jgi:hypothetical protein
MRSMCCAASVWGILLPITAQCNAYTSAIPVEQV